jgi:hypothetical protein
MVEFSLMVNFWGSCMVGWCSQQLNIHRREELSRLSPEK